VTRPMPPGEPCLLNKLCRPTAGIVVVDGRGRLLGSLWPLCGHFNWRKADQTFRFDRDSPGLERDVPVSRKGKFGIHLCPGLQKTVPVGTEGITYDFPVTSNLYT